jgi:iron complex transport system substrate-binding protein
MKKIFLIIATACLLLNTSCKHSGTTDTALNTDRIVCVSKQLNEIIFELGAGNHVVGTDLTSIYPDELKKLPKVGYHRLLNAEGIISLKPTLVIHDGNVAPAAVLTQLEKVGIAVKEFPEAKTIEETKSLIRQLGAVFKKEKKADSLCAKLDSDLAKAQARAKQYTDKPKVVVIHFGQQTNQYLVVGKKSVATWMLEQAGGQNAIDIDKGMGQLSAEIIAKAQPDVILATDVGFDQKGSAENFKTVPGIALTPAAKNNRIYRIDERDIIYFNPRTGENIMKIMDMIHK